MAEVTVGLGCSKNMHESHAVSLNRLPLGGRATVVGVRGDPDVRRRLLEMGFCNGATVEVIRRAPLGDPIEFRLRGYHLSLREEQARHVQVVPEHAQASAAPK